MSGIAITFPSSAVEGQSYLAQNGFTYIYDSQKNRWKRGGEFVRAPKVLSYAGVAVTTTGSGIATSPTGSLIYVIPGTVNPNSEVGVDSYKAYRAAESYPNYTEVQVSISSAFSTIAYAATFTGTTHTIPSPTLSGNTEYYLRARQFVGSNASAASTGAISGYSANPVKFTTASVFLDTPVIVSIAGTTQFPVYQIGFAGTTLPATVTYGGGGVGNLDKVEWRVTGPRIPSSTGDTALAEVGIGTHSSATLANALVLAMPFSGASGVGITSDVNNAIRTASGASAGTTKTVTANGGIGTSSIAGLALTSHFYPSAASGDGADDYLTVAATADLQFGSGDFTIEFWWYPNGTGRQALYHGSFGIDWSVGIDYSSVSTNQKIGIWASSNGSSWNMVNADAAGNGICNSVVPQKQWNHIAYVRRGNTFNLYLNGLLDCSASASGSIVDRSAYPAAIGTWYNNTALPEFTGYLQDLKIYKGLAKYTENFTPPLPTYGTISYTTGITNVGVATTAFFESTGDTPTAEVAIGSSTAAQVASSLVLAMPMNRTFGFQDINVAIRGLTSGASAGTAKTVGLGTTSTANAPSQPRISSTESKWYDGAAYFDGGDYATIPGSSDTALGAGDFTIEVWVRPEGNGSDEYIIFQNIGAGAGNFLFYRASSTAFNLYMSTSSGSWNVISGGDWGRAIAGQWTHLAVTRQSGTIKTWNNGVFIASFSSSTDFNSTDFIRLGSNTNGTGQFFNGYLQDFKIYKGFAKYTANFTPPAPICGFTTDISTQTGFTTTTATGALLSSTVGLGSTSTLAFSADQNLIGVTSITSSSGITTLPDPYAQNLVLALPLANITGVGNSFTNDRNTQIRSVSITGAGVTAGTTKTITNSGVTTVAMGSTSKWYDSTARFTGSSSYLAITPRTDFTPTGNTPFTFEAWIRPLTATDGTLFGTYYNTGSVGAGGEKGFLFYYNSSRTVTVYMRQSFSEGNIYPTTTTTIPVNTWTHIAIQMGAQTDIYFNGVLQPVTVGYFGTTSSADGTRNPITSYDANAVTYLGANIGTGTPTGFFNGYIQDVKIYGFRKYTTNFTPPPPMFGDYTRSTPNKLIFTPSSDYVLEARNTSGITTSSYSATRQWGTKPKGGIYDPYASNLVLAIPGGAVSAATSTYDVTGQIRYETPTTSYDNAGIVTYSNSLGIGTYQNKTVTNFTAPGTTYSNGTATNNGYYGSIDKTLMFDGNLNTYASWATDGITFTFTSSVPFTTLRLYCYVPTTPGNPAYFAVNGVSQTITKDTWLWHTVTGVSSPLSTIYGYGANGAPSIAAIEVNGSILIDGGFNITIDSNIKKYYNRSMKFRGNNYLSLATSNDFSPGTGDFTVEYWAYYSTVGPTVVVGATNGLWIGQNGANFVLRAYGVADLVSYSGSPPTNKWVHIAVTRQGTTAKIFFDGIQVASGTTSQNFIQSTLYIGTDSAGTYSSANITDLRIYKGVAKYTSNFTPPNQIYLT